MENQQLDSSQCCAQNNKSLLLRWVGWKACTYRQSQKSYRVHPMQIYSVWLNQGYIWRKQSPKFNLVNFYQLFINFLINVFSTFINFLSTFAWPTILLLQNVCHLVDKKLSMGLWLHISRWHWWPDGLQWWSHKPVTDSLGFDSRVSVVGWVTWQASQTSTGSLGLARTTRSSEVCRAV